MLFMPAANFSRGSKFMTQCISSDSDLSEIWGLSVFSILQEKLRYIMWPVSDKIFNLEWSLLSKGCIWCKALDILNCQDCFKSVLKPEFMKMIWLPMIYLQVKGNHDVCGGKIIICKLFSEYPVSGQSQSMLVLGQLLQKFGFLFKS
jgi:hypothetical protein